MGNRGCFVWWFELGGIQAPTNQAKSWGSQSLSFYPVITIVKFYEGNLFVPYISEMELAHHLCPKKPPFFFFIKSSLRRIHQVKVKNVSSLRAGSPSSFPTQLSPGQDHRSPFNLPGSTQGIDNHLQPSPRCLRLSGLWASGGPGLDLAHPCVPWM